MALNASEDVLFDSIQSHDVEELEWREYVFGRLSSVSFFKKLVGELHRIRFLFEDIWKYGVKRSDLQSTKDLVRMRMRMRRRIGLTFSSPMLTIDSMAEGLFNIREYNKS